MRTVSAVSLAALAVVVTVAGALAGCQPRTVTDTSRSVYCEVIADAPARDNDDAPKQVIAKTRFRCDEPGADSMSLTMRLQHQNVAGDWVDLAKTSFTASGAETVHTKDEAFRSRQVAAACTAGAFRTRVTGSSRSRGKTKEYDITGPRSFDPCRPSIFSGKE